MIYNFINKVKEGFTRIMVKSKHNYRPVYIKPEPVMIKNKQNNNPLNNHL